MKKEFITIREKEMAVKVQNTKINAVRRKDILRKGVRVYEHGKIGISGALGHVPDDVLIKNATENLSTSIAYPYELESNLKDHRNYNSSPLKEPELLSNAEGILEELRQKYTDFDFSETILTKEVTYQMKNSVGLDLEYKDAYMSLELVLKEKKSANLLDGLLLFKGRSFDIDKFWTFNNSYLEAYHNRVPLPEGDVLPVFTLDFHELNGFLSRALNGERYATGSSLFSKKMGEKLFNKKVTLEQNRCPKLSLEPFFDMEGVVLHNDRYALIENGKLVRVFTDKKTADQYNLPHTGSASGAYDDMPALSSTPLRFAIDSEDIDLAGQMAVLVVISSGGDFTPDGSFAAPVQVSFLFDGRRIIGKLPEFTMRSHIYKLLGDDYIGTFANKHIYIGDGSRLQGHYMTIVRS